MSPEGQRRWWVAGGLLLALLTLGCSIVSPFRKLHDEPGPPGLAGALMVRADEGVDYRFDRFRLQVSPGAVLTDRILMLTLMNPASAALIIPSGTIPLTPVYSLRLRGQDGRLLQPARLELPITPPHRLSPDTAPDIFMGARGSDGTWRFHSPDQDFIAQVAGVDTWTLSDWVVLLRKPGAGPGLRTAPVFLITPTAPLVDDNGRFAEDLQIETGWEGAPGTSAAVPEWQTELTLFPEPALPLEGAAPDGMGTVSALPPDSPTGFRVPLGEGSFVRSVFGPNAASYSFRLILTGKTSSQVPHTLAWRVVARRAREAPLVREGRVVLQPQIAARQVVRPRVLSTVPADMARDIGRRPVLEIRFDRVMDPGSVERALSIFPDPGPRTWQWRDGRTATFRFLDPLPLHTQFQMTLAATARDIRGVTLENPFRWAFSTGATADVVPPFLEATQPPAGSRNLPRNTWITLQFSEPMWPPSVERGVAVTSPEVGSLSWFWSTDRTTVGVLPTGLWLASLTHEIEVGTACQDLEGNPLAKVQTLRFTTQERTGPTIVETRPEAGVPLRLPLSALRFRFDRAMDPTSVGAALSLGPAAAAPPVPTLTWEAGGTVLVLGWAPAWTPTAPLVASFTTRARDTDGVPLAGQTRFEYPLPDLTAPQLVSFTPSQGATGVPTNSPVFLRFSEPMNRDSVERACSSSPPTTARWFLWNESSDQVWINPGTAWPASSRITFHLATGPVDLHGNALAQPFTLAFTTAAGPAPALAAATPRDGQTAVSRTTPVSLRFTHSMDPNSVAAALSLFPTGASPYAMAWQDENRILTIGPAALWGNATHYELQLTQAARSAGGVPLVQPIRIVFTTADTEPPALVRVVPVEGATGVNPFGAFELAFDEPVDRATLEAALSVSPAPAGRPVFTWVNDQIVRFHWSGGLVGNTLHTLRVGTGLADAAGNRLPVAFESRFTTADTTPPTLVDTTPTPDTTGLPLQPSLKFVFSKPMDPKTVTLGVTPAGGAPILSWSADGQTLTVSFAAPLAPETTYLATLDGTAADRLGLLLTGTRSLSFRTGSLDTPRLLTFLPSDGETVPTLTLRLEMTFDRAMDRASVAAAATLAPAPAGGMVWSWNEAGTAAVAGSTGPLQAGTAYRFTVAATACDALGVSLGQEIHRTFTTDTAPTVVLSGVFPADGASGVASGVVIRVPFSKPMDHDTTDQACELLLEGQPVAATRRWDGPTRLLLTPAAPLRPHQAYTLLIGRGARDQNGIPLATAVTIRFTTSVERSVTAAAITPASGAANVDPATPLVVAFAEPMETATVRTLLRPDPGQEPQTAWTDGARRLTVTFPLGLAPDTAWEWTVAADARAQSGNLVIPPGSFTFSTLARPNPRVIATVPGPGQTGIDPRSALQLTFDQNMDRASVQAAIGLAPAPVGTPTFTWANDRAVTITFAQPLAYATAYTLTVGTGARSATDIPLAGSLTQAFTTIARPAVVVTQVVPAGGATGVGPTTGAVLPFSRAMDQGSVNAALTVTADGAPLAVGSIWDGPMLRLLPAGGWPLGKTIGIGIAATAADLAGHALGTAFTTSFTTLPPEPPAVTSISPAPGSADVALDSPLVIVFSKAMASPTVGIVISPIPIGSVVRQWSADGKTLTLTVPEGWNGNTAYAVTVAATSRDTSETALGTAFTSGFTTAAPPAGPRLVGFLPAAGTTDIPIRTSLELRFDTAMATASVQAAFSLTPTPAAAPTWSWSADRTIATLTWSQPLSFGQVYTAQVAVTARSQAGLALALPFQGTFVTEVAPAVTAVQPSAGAGEVATDSPVVVTFSKEMDRPSVEQAFTLVGGTGALPGTFAWSTTRLTFRPTGGMPASTTLTMAIGTTARDTRGNPLSERFSSTFITVPPPPCRLTASTPTDGQTGVSVTTPLVLYFSTPMARATVDVLVNPAPTGGKTLTWSNDDTRLTVAFGGALAGGQTHQVTVAASARDVFGAPLTGATGFSFVTQAVTTPIVTACAPVPGTLEVPVTTVMRFTFDRAMDAPTTQAAFSLVPAAGTPQFAWSADRRTLSVTIPDRLAFATFYEAAIGPTARDAGGIALGEVFITGFRTEARPAVVNGSEYPVPGSEGLPTDTPVRMAFTKAMDRPATAGAFRLETPAGVAVAGTFTWPDERTVEFRPTAPLAMSLRYRVTVTTGSRDQHGNALSAPVTWEFTTRGMEGANWRLDLADDIQGDQFSPRKNHAVASFLDSLWVIGGNDGQFRNDVWRSPDGVTWTRVLADNPTTVTRFSPRAGHACLVFANKLWVIGGETDTGTGYDTLDDVWWTTNGVDWTRATASADFWARAYHSAVVFDNRMWLLGGMSYDSEGMPLLLDDAWTSTDGQTWTEVAAAASFFPRMRSTAAVFGGRLWVFGGHGINAAGAEGPLADAWYTTTGQTWIRAAEQAGFPARAGATLLSYQNRLWLIGGSGLDETGWDLSFNDVWATSDGQTWNRVLDNAPAGAQRFAARADSAATVHRSRMVLLGGETEWGVANDVWSTD